MTYHEFSECTLTPTERKKEADEILRMFFNEGVERIDFTDSERGFFESMQRANHISVRQLFWLRDLKDKYL